MSDIRAHRRRRRAIEPGAVNGYEAEDEDGFVSLDQLHSHHWQVVDRRRPTRDPFRVLALITYVAGSYEVMQFGRGFEWKTFASLDQALAHVVVTSAALARTRSSDDDTWAPHSEATVGCRPRQQLHPLLQSDESDAESPVRPGDGP